MSTRINLGRHVPAPDTTAPVRAKVTARRVMMAFLPDDWTLEGTVIRDGKGTIITDDVAIKLATEKGYRE